MRELPFSFGVLIATVRSCWSSAFGEIQGLVEVDGSGSVAPFSFSFSTTP